MRSAAIQFLTLAGLASPIQAEALGQQSLDELIAFTDPAKCTEAPAFLRFRRSLFRYDKATDVANFARPDIPPTFQGAFGPPRYSRNSNGVTISFPLHGTWHGLRLRTFAAYAWNGGDPGGFTILFSEPPAKVRAIVNRLGFAIPPNGIRELPDELEGAEIKVIPERRGSLFGCTS